MNGKEFSSNAALGLELAGRDDSLRLQIVNLHLAGVALTSHVRLSRPKFSAALVIFLSWRREAILV